MIKINLGLLEKQLVELDGEEPAEWLGVEATSQLTVTSPVTYHLMAKLVSGSVLVRGEVSYQIEGSCGRCLADVQQEIVVDDLSLLYDMPPGEELDITDDVREEALLELPVNVLCSDDCAGLCPQCGVNWNDEECDCIPKETPEEESPWGALDDLELK